MRSDRESSDRCNRLLLKNKQTGTKNLEMRFNDSSDYEGFREGVVAILRKIFFMKLHDYRRIDLLRARLSKEVHAAKTFSLFTHALHHGVTNSLELELKHSLYILKILFIVSLRQEESYCY